MREPTFSNEIGRINKQMDRLETKVISAKDLIDYCKHYIELYKGTQNDKARREMLLSVIGEIVNMPSAIPKLDEWCTDCKEYNIANHNCPRFNRVIRRTVEEIQHKSKSVIYHGDGYADGCMVYDTAECPSCGYIFDAGDSVWKESFCPHCGQELEW